MLPRKVHIGIDQLQSLHALHTDHKTYTNDVATSVYTLKTSTVGSQYLDFIHKLRHYEFFFQRD